MNHDKNRILLNFYSLEFDTRCQKNMFSSLILVLNTITPKIV